MENVFKVCAIAKMGGKELIVQQVFAKILVITMEFVQKQEQFLLLINILKCKCLPGWRGDECDIKTCKDNCNNHGECNIKKYFRSSKWSM